MPELPEVEVIRRGLLSVLPGKTIADVNVSEARSFPDFDQALSERLVGTRVQDVLRRGKLLMVYLEAGSEDATDGYDHSGDVLLIHLRMTGQLIYRGFCSEDDPALAGGYPNASLIGELPDKSTRVIIGFDDASKLFFNDQRKFGYLKLMTISDLDQESFLMSLGPEPLDAGFTWQQLRAALGGSGSRGSLKGGGKAQRGGGKAQRPVTISVKAALLDQHRVAGIGNIYADESLFRARINPHREVSSLKPSDYQRLLAGIRECLLQSIEDGGSTARNYVDALGLRGEFLDRHAAVYGRAGQPCPRCQKPISKIRLAGRGTHFCEKCQR